MALHENRLDIEDIRQTEIWELYEKGRNYHRITGIYADTDKNYRFYNGNQWEGAKLGDVEPVQYNFIRPIVNYKVAVVHDNLYAINYSSQNYESREFHKEAERYCDLLNAYAGRIWERDKMDFKGRNITEDAAINDEGIIYVDFDEEKMQPVNEELDKVDVYYGDENSEDIQSQPYILIRKRMPVSNAIDLALAKGASDEDILFIIGDNDNFEQGGDAAKYELDNKVTVIYKLYKKDGTVRFSAATRFADICEDRDTGLSLYPLAHITWQRKKGSARGEGEVRYLIPNQIELNRTEIRRVLTAKFQAFPKTVVDVTKISNPQAVNTVGGVIKTNGAPVDDVHKIVGTIPPAQMSPDVKQLQDDLIQITRDLAGAGDTATGQVDPESASGRAILAVQQASQAPMTRQKESYKNFIEDLARIWLEYLIVYSVDGVQMEEELTDPQTGEEYTQLVTVRQETLRQLQATVKIDITPKGPYDRYAQELTLENLLKGGFFSPEMSVQTRAYIKSLPDESVAPKQLIEKALDYVDDQQRRIAEIQARAQEMQQRAEQFLMADPDGQAAQISDAMSQMDAEAALEAEEAQYAEKEAALDEETAAAEAETDEE